jgi:hypothetical protein
MAYSVPPTKAEKPVAAMVAETWCERTCYPGWIPGWDGVKIPSRHA